MLDALCGVKGEKETAARTREVELLHERQAEARAADPVAQAAPARGVPSVEPQREHPGAHVRRAQLQHGRAARLECVDAQLELRAQQAPQVEHDAPLHVQPARVQLPVLILPPLDQARHLDGPGFRVQGAGRPRCT